MRRLTPLTEPTRVGQVGSEPRGDVRSDRQLRRDGAIALPADVHARYPVPGRFQGRGLVGPGRGTGRVQQVAGTGHAHGRRHRLERAQPYARPVLQHLPRRLEGLDPRIGVQGEDPRVAERPVLLPVVRRGQRHPLRCHAQRRTGQPVEELALLHGPGRECPQHILHEPRHDVEAELRRPPLHAHCAVQARGLPSAGDPARGRRRVSRAHRHAVHQRPEPPLRCRRRLPDAQADAPMRRLRRSQRRQLRRPYVRALQEDGIRTRTAVRDAQGDVHAPRLRREPVQPGRGRHVHIQRSLIVGLRVELLVPTSFRAQLQRRAQELARLQVQVQTARQARVRHRLAQTQIVQPDLARRRSGRTIVDRERELPDRRQVRRPGPVLENHRVRAVPAPHHRRLRHGSLRQDTLRLRTQGVPALEVDDHLRQPVLRHRLAAILRRLQRRAVQVVVLRVRPQLHQQPLIARRAPVAAVRQRVQTKLAIPQEAPRLLREPEVDLRPLVRLQTLIAQLQAPLVELHAAGTDGLGRVRDLVRHARRRPVVRALRQPAHRRDPERRRRRAEPFGRVGQPGEHTVHAPLRPA